MNKLFIKIRSSLSLYFNDPLIKNSYYLMGNTLINASVGFFFWIIAARLYSSYDIGLGSAIISSIGLLTLFSLFGFDISLIRFLPSEKNKMDMINSCLFFSSLINLILVITFIIGLSIWSPSLIFLQSNLFFGFLFCFFAILNTLNYLQISIFVGLRSAKHSLFQSIPNFFRILFLPILISIGTLGIYSSFGLSYLISFLLGNRLISHIIPEYKIRLSLKRNIVYKLFSYSLGNYIANIFINLTNFLLPLIVLNSVGANLNAYFYISWTFSSILLMIPFSISRSLLAEISYSKDTFYDNVKKSLSFSLLLLGGSLILILFLGKYLLLLFGKEYSLNSFEPLLIFSIASIPYAVNQIYITIKRLEKKIKPVIIIYLTISMITIIISYMFIKQYGLNIIGYAWLFSNSFIAILLIIKRFWRKS